MCTLILKNQKPVKAIKNITVYKRLKFVDGEYYSIFNNYHYVKDVLNKTIFSYTDTLKAFDKYESRYRLEIESFNLHAVAQGFHSLKTPDRTRLDGTICEFIIPKGALYYMNPRENIVSNKIIFKGELTKTLKLWI